MFFLVSDTASALVSVLVIIVVVTMIAGAVFVYATVQHRFFARDVQLLEARYAAEAAVYEALLHMGTEEQPVQSEISVTFENGATGTATITVHGAFRIVSSRGRRGRQAVDVHALAGRTPGTAFSDAIHTMDPHAGLVLAGSTSVIGDVRTGSPGVRTERFRAQPFTGSFEGEALPPGLDISFSDHVRGLFVQWLNIVNGVDLSLDAETLFLEGDHVVPCEPNVESADPTHEQPLPRSQQIVVTGDATLPPGCRLEPATTVISGGTVHVAGALDAPRLLIFGREGVTFAPGAAATGQFFSEGSITVSEDVYLSYPTLLYSSGALIDRNSDWQSELRGSDTAYITLQPGAVVDGVVAVPPAVAEAHRTTADIVIEDGATVRGAVINARSTTLHGSVHGSVITDQFRFYHSPTFYVNWLKDATVDVAARPEPFAVPFVVAGDEKAVIVDWWEE